MTFKGEGAPDVVIRITQTKYVDDPVFNVTGAEGNEVENKVGTASPTSPDRKRRASVNSIAQKGLCLCGCCQASVFCIMEVFYNRKRES